MYFLGLQSREPNRVAFGPGFGPKYYCVTDADCRKEGWDKDMKCIKQEEICKENKAKGIDGIVSCGRCSCTDQTLDKNKYRHSKTPKYLKLSNLMNLY